MFRRNASIRAPKTPLGRRGRFTGLRVGVIGVMGALVATAASAQPAPRTGGFTLTMPPGAKVNDLTPFQPCTFKGLPTRGDDAAECATFVAPEDRAKPEGRLIALPVVRLPALKAGALEPVYWLQGGPGATNLSLDVDGRALFEGHDIYMLGYRGVDDQSPLQCPELSDAATTAHPLSAKAASVLTKAARSCAARLTASGIDLSHYTMFDVIADHEALRDALHVPRVDLISDSYGTRVAQYYTRLHPASVLRSVQIGANPPGHFHWYPAATNEVLREYAQRCAKNAACASRTSDLFKTVVGTLARNDLTYNGAPIDMDKVRLTAQFMVMSRSSALDLFDATIAAEKGDNSGLAQMAGVYDVVIRTATVWGDMLSKGGGESRGPEAQFVAQRQSNATSFGSPLDLLYAPITKGWPTKAWGPGFDKVARDETPTLLIGGNLDLATPIKYAQTELLPQLPNGHLVLLKDQGHDDWEDEQKPELDQLIAGFLKDGVVDASAYALSPIPFK